MGVGSCCGTGMYLVAGMVARNLAGPGVVFSFIIAAVASIFSGIYLNGPINLLNLLTHLKKNSSYLKAHVTQSLVYECRILREALICTHT